MSGKLFLIVGPSGSGKSSVFEGLKTRHPEFMFPLSATTRPMRPGEKDGDIYHFFTKERFEEGIRKGDFLEHAVVHQDNYYGLIKAPVLKALDEGKTVIREVDIQGFESIRRVIPKEQLITIFITVPNVRELVDRIQHRAQMSGDELKKRLKSMQIENKKARECDYLVENHAGELEQTVGKVEAIIEREMKA
ncbi:guanylate kinase [Candidatus Peregrinibacteria bacterium]|nr:guanylate kinase [Candidatus Peregrinibacteria bacterium]